jgi:hypothetical protein
MEHAPVHQFTGISQLRKLVRSQTDSLRASLTNQQYLVFWGVTNDHLDQIDRQRHSIGKDIRLKHHTNINLLIVKLMPSPEHDIAVAVMRNAIGDAVLGVAKLLHSQLDNIPWRHHLKGGRWSIHGRHPTAVPLSTLALSQ